MTHTKTRLQLSPGVNVIIGPNNCGKSAVVEAIRCLATNSSSGKVLKRHGAKVAKVIVTTEEGHRIEWHRDDNSSWYILNGNTIARLGQTVHHDVRNALRLDPVSVSTKDEASDRPKPPTGIDVHFALQKEPIFLLGNGPAEIARYFASASDVDLVLKMQRMHRQKTLDSQKDLKQLELQLERRKRRVEILDPVLEVDGQFRNVNRLYDDIQRLQEGRARLRSYLSSALDLQQDFAEHDLVSKALESLVPPPRLDEVHVLRTVIAQVKATERTILKKEAEKCALSILVKPPSLDDTKPLRHFCETIRRGESATGVLNRRLNVLGSLAKPPELLNHLPLREAVDKISREATNARELHIQLDSIVAKLKLIRIQIESLAKDAVCPKCGGSISIDQFLAVPHA